MKKDIIINSTANEHRIAILEDGKTAELFVETPGKDRNVGDIYLGKVAKVMPGIRAAFIDIGMEQDAFLHFSDIGSIEEYNSLFEDDEDEKEEETADIAKEAVLQGSSDVVQINGENGASLTGEKPTKKNYATINNGAISPAQNFPQVNLQKGPGYTCPDYERTGREKRCTCSFGNFTSRTISRSDSIRR